MDKSTSKLLQHFHMNQYYKMLVVKFKRWASQHQLLPDFYKILLEF